MNAQLRHGQLKEKKNLVRKDSYAAVLFVTTLNQFFLSFLVPVVIELGSESKMIRRYDKLRVVTHNHYSIISCGRGNH